MKKGILALLLTALLLFGGAALADAQTDWNQQCVLKTSAAASVYVWHTASTATPSDLEAGTLDPVRTLMAGTYIKRSADDDICQAYQMARISFCLNGSVSTGYIDVSLIAAATARVRLSNGQYVQVPEALMIDSAALSKYLWAHYGMGPALSQGEEGDAPGESLPVSDPGDYSLTYILVDDEEDSITTLHAEMITPGFAYSTVIVGGQQMVVPTVDLDWPSVAPVDQRLASVYAPRTGKAYLYAGSSNRTKIIGKAPAGRVVLVLKIGTYFSRVWCDGTVGFIQTSALTFHGVVKPEDVSAAIVAKNGRTEGAVKVNVRIREKANTRIVAAPVLGTPVTVLSASGEWTEIEVNGIHGFIQSKYLIPQED